MSIINNSSTLSQFTLQSLQRSKIERQLQADQNKVATNEKNLSYKTLQQDVGVNIKDLLSKIQNSSSRVQNFEQNLAEIKNDNVALNSLLQLSDEIKVEFIKIFDITNYGDSQATISILESRLGELQSVLNTQDLHGNYIFGGGAKEAPVQDISMYQQGNNDAEYQPGYYYHGANSDRIVPLDEYNILHYGINANDKAIEAIIGSINQAIMLFQKFPGSDTDMNPNSNSSTHASAIQAALGPLTLVVSQAVDNLSNLYTSQLCLEQQIGIVLNESKYMLQELETKYQDVQCLSDSEILALTVQAKELSKLLEILGMIANMCNKSQREYLSALFA